MTLTLATPAQAITVWQYLKNSFGECTYRWRTQNIDQRIDRNGYNRMVSYFKDNVEFQRALLIEKDVVLEEAKNTCGGYFCTEQEALKVLTDFARRHQAAIVSSVRTTRLPSVSSLVPDYLELDSPSLLRLLFGFFGAEVLNDLAMRGNLIHELISYSLLFGVFEAASQVRGNYDAAKALREYFKSLPEEEAYEPAGNAGSNGATANAGNSGTNKTRRLRIVALFRDFREFNTVNGIIESLNKDPGDFFNRISRTSRNPLRLESVAVWIQEMIQYGRQKGLKKLLIPIEYAATVNMAMEGMGIEEHNKLMGYILDIDNLVNPDKPMPRELKRDLESLLIGAWRSAAI